MKKKYFILAAIFLFNPIISIIDIFPDFFADLLLMTAIKKASYLYDAASDAYDALKKMLIVSGAKLFCMTLLPFTDATMALVFSFAFAIIEAIYAFSAFSKLFDAIAYLSIRCDEGQNEKRCDKMKKFTYVFVIVRLVFASLPDFTALADGSMNKKLAQLTNLRPVLFALTAVFMLVVGIVWLAMFINFTNKVLSEKMLTKIENNFNEQIAPRKTIFISRDAMASLILLLVGVFFVFDFNYELYNIVPDCIFSLFALASYIFMRKKGYIEYKKTHLVFIFAVILHTITCILEMVYEKIYVLKYDYVNARIVEDAQKMYTPVAVFALISSLIFVLIVVLILSMVKKYSIKVIIENPQFYCEKDVSGFKEEFEKELKKRNTITIILSIILFIEYTLTVIFTPSNEALTVLNSVFEAIFIFFFFRNILYAYDEIFVKMKKYS